MQRTTANQHQPSNSLPPYQGAVVRHTQKDIGDQLSAAEGVRRDLRKLIHDLKLPLTLVNGELEAIEDGIRPWTTETTRTLLTEIEQLKDMLTAVNDDNHQQQEDAGDMSILLRQHLQTLQHQQSLMVTTDITANIRIRLDATSFKRIVHNLCSNTLKYTYQPGRVEVQFSQQHRHAILLWQDSAPAPESHELPLLGHDNYRTQLALQGQCSGSGSGTGLASVCDLVYHAEGNITFAHNSLGGLTVRIELPLAD